MLRLPPGKILSWKVRKSFSSRRFTLQERLQCVLHLLLECQSWVSVNLGKRCTDEQVLDRMIASTPCPNFVTDFSALLQVFQENNHKNTRISIEEFLFFVKTYQLKKLLPQVLFLRFLRYQFTQGTISQSSNVIDENSTWKNVEGNLLVEERVVTS